MLNYFDPKQKLLFWFLAQNDPKKERKRNFQSRRWCERKFRSSWKRCFDSIFSKIRLMQFSKKLFTAPSNGRFSNGMFIFKRTAQPISKRPLTVGDSNTIIQSRCIFLYNSHKLYFVRAIEVRLSFHQRGFKITQYLHPKTTKLSICSY